MAPPRVAQAPAALECKVTSTLELEDVSGAKTGAIVVIGQVIGVHIDEAVIRDGRFDVALAKPVSRLGYMDYGHTSGIHERIRPDWKE